MQQIWQREISDLLRELNCDPARGLSAQEAKQRLVKHGPNQLQEGKKQSPWMLFFAQFNNFIIWVLIAAAIVSGNCLNRWKHLRREPCPEARRLNSRARTFPALNPLRRVKHKVGDRIPIDFRATNAVIRRLS